MRQQLPEWWATTRTGSKMHLTGLLGTTGLCGEPGLGPGGSLAGIEGPDGLSWCQSCRSVAESVTESVRAELAHLERIGVL